MRKADAHRRVTALLAHERRTGFDYHNPATVQRTYFLKNRMTIEPLLALIIPSLMREIELPTAGDRKMVQRLAARLDCTAHNRDRVVAVASRQQAGAHVTAGHC
jgi:hypothetical protein